MGGIVERHPPVGGAETLGADGRIGVIHSVLGHEEFLFLRFVTRDAAELRRWGNVGAWPDGAI